MTARDAARAVLVMDLVVGGLSRAAAEAKVTAFEQAQRAGVLREAADFVRDAHFRDGLSVQEIGTALRFMADAPTPTSKEQQR